MYRVYDSLGNFMKEFPTSEQAENYRNIGLAQVFPGGLAGKESA